MATIQNESIIPVLPYLYKYGLATSNDSSIQLHTTAGQCRDSQNTIDMPSAGVLHTLTNFVGAGGLDSGTIAANRMYALYLIGDSRNNNPTSTILSLASNSVPTLPFGYDSYRIISYWPTDVSSNLLTGYYTGLYGNLIFKYDAPQATSITAGNATTYTAIDLSALVPTIRTDSSFCLANIQYAFTPGAASRTLSLQGVGSSGTAITVVGQVTSVVMEGYVDVTAQLTAGVPKINYQVSNSGDAVNIKVAGFTVSI